MIATYIQLVDRSEMRESSSAVSIDKFLVIKDYLELRYRPVMCAYLKKPIQCKDTKLIIEIFALSITLCHVSPIIGVKLLNSFFLSNLVQIWYYSLNV